MEIHKLRNDQKVGRMSAEQRVKSVYPEAEWKWDWVTLPSATDTWKTYRFLPGVWIDDRCLAFGGKIETYIWRRAWKLIQKEMLKKLEG